MVLCVVIYYHLEVKLIRQLTSVIILGATYKLGCLPPTSAKKWKDEVYCFFLQVRHKFELIIREVSAKNKAL